MTADKRFISAVFIGDLALAEQALCYGANVNAREEGEAVLYILPAIAETRIS